MSKNKKIEFKFKNKAYFVYQIGKQKKNRKIYSTTDNKFVFKQLIIKNANKKTIERFRNEIEAHKKLTEEKIENIAEFIDYEEQNSFISLKLKKYEGDATAKKVLNYTRHNLKNTIKLLIPIIKVLYDISQRKKAIYHRDIKPQNLLYKIENNTPILYLADFGCVFIKDISKEKRITSDFEWVGAQDYRAPEFQYGRVENIDNTGDIFSIGKLFWYFFNGNENEIFPYTLWFPKAYNLEHRLELENNNDVTFLNIIIARSTHHDPSKRISYSGLIKLIKNYENNISIGNNKMKLDPLIHEQKQQLKIEYETSLATNLTKMVINYLKDIMDDISSKHPLSQTIKELKQSLPINGYDIDYKEIRYIVTHPGPSLRLNTAPNVTNTTGLYKFELSLHNKHMIIKSCPEIECPCIQFNMQILHPKENSKSGIYVIWQEPEGMFLSKKGSITTKVAFTKSNFFNIIDEFLNELFQQD